ncbi:MAG: hypothetical protein R3277_07250 [Brumimicrobium sp.]|nr:hypothetical protein [Brumimicrobium sp.]
MKNTLLILYIIFLATSCSTESNRKEQEDNKRLLSSDTITEISANNDVIINDDSSIIYDEFDFLSDCDSLQIWQGGIQGTPSDDLTCCYLMAQCQTNKHFDLIIYSESQLELEDGADYKNNRIRDDIKKVEYFAFEIPKKKPDNPENEFDTFDYVYPSTVTVYKRKNKNWEVIQKVKIHSFEELGELKLNTLKNIHNSK